MVSDPLSEVELRRGFDEMVARFRRYPTRTRDRAIVLVALSTLLVVLFPESWISYWIAWPIVSLFIGAMGVLILGITVGAVYAVNSEHEEPMPNRFEKWLEHHIGRFMLYILIAVVIVGLIAGPMLYVLTNYVAPAMSGLRIWLRALLIVPLIPIMGFYLIRMWRHRPA